jgi:sensor histidine kinase YesM
MQTEVQTGLTRKQFYWSCQLGGWLLYIFAFALLAYFNGGFNGNIAFGLTLIFLIGILLTQFLRWIIIRFNWLKFSIPKVLPRILLTNILMSGIVSFIQIGFERINSSSAIANFDGVRFGFIMLDFTFTFFFWSVIYYMFHFFENYKMAEIENLKWQASIKEIELNKLKSQLNPHFMFNAMNSIRALIVENPERAKEAITHLSNLLRNTLQMGKQKFIPLSQEIDAVKDYISIQSIRFEERLKVEWKISPGADSFEVPPLMVQTLVENGIKHGIAKLPQGGNLSIAGAVTEKGLQIIIRNSGHYDATEIPESGFGMKNTLERLELLYSGRASFSIANEDKETVIANLFIPTNNGTK